MCRGCRGRRTRDIHYCSKSPDEGLNTTFWLNRSPWHVKNTCLLLPYTCSREQGYTHACTWKHAWSNWDLRQSGSSFLRSGEQRSRTEPQSVPLWGVARKGWFRKPRTSQIPKFPKGHAVKYTNHKCLALSNRFRTLCMSKQTQHCLWVCLHYIYICLGISYFKLNNTVPFSCECYDNNTLWNIFYIEDILGFFCFFLAK